MGSCSWRRCWARKIRSSASSSSGRARAWSRRSGRRPAQRSPNHAGRPSRSMSSERRYLLKCSRGPRIVVGRRRRAARATTATRSANARGSPASRRQPAVGGGAARRRVAGSTSKPSTNAAACSARPGVGAPVGRWSNARSIRGRAAGAASSPSPSRLDAEQRRRRRRPACCGRRTRRGPARRPAPGRRSPSSSPRRRRAGPRPRRRRRARRRRRRRAPPPAPARCRRRRGRSGGRRRRPRRGDRSPARTTRRRSVRPPIGSRLRPRPRRSTSTTHDPSVELDLGPRRADPARRRRGRSAPPWRSSISRPIVASACGRPRLGPAEERGALGGRQQVAGVDRRGDQGDVGVARRQVLVGRGEPVEPRRVDVAGADLRAVEQVEQERLVRRAAAHDDRHLRQRAVQPGERLGAVAAVRR